MAGNFQRIAEPSPARYKEKGLEYFMQAPMLEAELQGAQQKALNGIDINTTGLSQQDTPKAQEMQKFLDTGKEKFSDKILEGGMLSDSEITDLLKLTANTKEYNKELVQGVKRNEDRKAKRTHIQNLMYAKDANVPYYQKLLSEADKNWQGGMGPNGTDYDISLANAPRLVDTLGNYRRDLAAASQNISAADTVTLEEFKAKLSVTTNDKTRTIIQQAMNNIYTSSSAVRDVAERYKRQISSSESDDGKLADFIGNRDALLAELPSIAEDFVRTKFVPAGYRASVSNLPTTPAVQPHAIPGVVAKNQDKTGRIISPNPRVETNSSITDDKYSIFSTSDKSSRAAKTLEKKYEANLEFLTTNETYSGSRGGTSIIDAMNKFNKKNNNNEVITPATVDIDRRAYAEHMKNKEVVGYDVDKFNKDNHKFIGDIVGDNKAFFNSNVTYADVSDYLNGTVLTEAQSTNADGNVTRYPDTGFQSYINDLHGVKLDKYRVIQKNLRRLEIMEGSLNITNSSSFSLPSNYKTGNINLDEYVDTQNIVLRDMKSLYNDYNSKSNDPIHTQSIGFTQSYIDKNQMVKMNDTYDTKYKESISSSIANGHANIIGLSYDDATNKTSLDFSSLLDTDSKKGVASDVNFANLIRSGKVNRPVKLGPFSDLEKLAPSIFDNMTEAQITTAKKEFEGGLLYTYVNDDGNTKMVVVENTGADRIKDPIADLPIRQGTKDNYTYSSSVYNEIDILASKGSAGTKITVTVPRYDPADPNAFEHKTFKMAYVQGKYVLTPYYSTLVNGEVEMKAGVPQYTGVSKESLYAKLRNKLI